MLDVPSYLLRLQLADRPGSLGSVAVALGTVGADILSLDVVERGPGYAIDDLVIDLPPGSMPDSLITAAEALNGVHVHSIRPHTGLLEAHRELELIDRVAAAAASARLEVLAQEAPHVLRANWCTVVGRTAPDSSGWPEARAPPRHRPPPLLGCR
ncbi:amino acid-binding ACT [Mycobacteroides abscessus]|nr:amino acid-binding ACT [Mycobacteroides abscessus]